MKEQESNLVNQAAAAEQTSFYHDNKISETPLKTKGKKKKGPIIAIVASILGVSSSFFFLNQMMPFHLVTQFGRIFDAQYSSRHMRMTSRFLRFYANMSEADEFVKEIRPNGVTKLHRTRFTKKITSKKNIKRLKNQGITVLKKGDILPDNIIIAEGSTLVLADKGIARGRPITIDQVGGISSNNVMLKGAKLKEPLVLYAPKKGGDVLGMSADSFHKFYLKNDEFRHNFNRGTRSFTGRIAGWIDLSVARFLDNYNLTKNLFKNWINNTYDAEGRNSSFIDIIKRRRNGTMAGSGEGRLAETVDSDGKISKSREYLGEDHAHTTTKSDIMKKITQIGQVATEGTCAAAGIASMLTFLQFGIAVSNSISYYSNIAEAVSKTKAGDAASPLSDLSNRLSETRDGKPSALEAEGMKHAMSGGNYNPDRNHETIKSVSYETILQKATSLGGLGAAGTTVGAIIACAVSGTIFSVASAIADFLTFKAFSVGKAAVSAVVMGGIIAGFSFAVDQVVKAANSNFCLESSNEDQGACTALGGAAFYDHNFMIGGGRAASRDKVESFYKNHQAALSLEAKEERATKSPFDTSSPNTFLGSIFTSLYSAGINNKPLTYFGRILKSAAISSRSIFPSVKAADESNIIRNRIGNCPDLEAIGAVGDFYCRPIVVSDTDTLDYDPNENYLNLIKSGNFLVDENGEVAVDKDGVEIINPNSELGKRIVYCNERQSPFGLVDQNILNTESGIINTTSGWGMAGRTIIGFVPVLGDLFNIAENANVGRALPWATGERCVVNKNSSAIAKAADRYIEDDRMIQISDNEDPARKRSSVLAFMERHEAENPPDKSLEGYLARLTGYTPKQISWLLNEIEYQTHIASYDPALVWHPQKDQTGGIDLLSLYQEEDLFRAPQISQVEFLPLKNRSFAV